MQLLYELEPAKIYSLIDRTSFSATSFSGTEVIGYSRIAEGAYARTASNTMAKIELLKALFEFCDVEANELSFEMPLDIGKDTNDK